MNLLLILAAALLCSSPAQAEAALRRYALVVGANQGGQGRAPLRYATTDASAMDRVLGDLGGVAPQDRILLMDPSRAGLEAGLQELGRRLTAAPPGQRREVIFYYSGHSDENGLLLSGERLDYSSLRSLLSALPADVRVAVLDSCASGAFVRTKGGQHVAPFLVDESTTVSGHAFLTSSSEDEAAQEADRISGSYFTHALVTGLRGGADLDQDGRVTLHEAYWFAHEETLSRTETSVHGPQHAAYDIQLAGTGDLVLTDLRATSARLIFEPGLEGRLSLRDQDGRLVAELYKAGSRPLELGLPPGRYEVLLEREGQRYKSIMELKDGEPTALGESDFDLVLLGLASARGGAPLPPLEDRSLVLELVPGAPGAQLERHHIAVGMLGVSGGALEGWSAALGVTLYDQYVQGGQVAVGFNSAQGPVEGLQVAVGANHAGGRLEGTQVAVGANLLMGPMEGVQVAEGLNLAWGDMQGVQVSAGANISRAVGDGVQVTAGANLAEELEGVQVSAGVNLLHQGEGAQVSTVNVAQELKGSQVGVVNFGQRVEGVQVGLINTGGDVDVTIGLLNFIREGIHQVEVYGSSDLKAGAGLKLGGRSTYTYYGLELGQNAQWETVDWQAAAGGAQPEPWAAEGDSVSVLPVDLGLGLGLRRSWGRWSVDADVGSWLYGDAIFAEKPQGAVLITAPRLRAGAAWALQPHLQPFATAALTAVWTDLPALEAPLWSPGVAGGEVLLWPTLQAGLRF